MLNYSYSIASIIPSEFFGTDDEPPPFHLLKSLGHLFSSFERLQALTLPLPDHALTFKMLGIPRNLTSLHLTHVQPTPSLIAELAFTCPKLEELFFCIYFFTVRTPHCTTLTLNAHAVR